MRLGIVAALALIASTPPVSAQAPEPDALVEAACATVGAADPQARALLPLCPRDEPAAAAPAEAQAEAPAAPAPASPEGVQELVGEIVEDVQAIPEDPAGAPERLLAIVATLVQFAKDVLGLPAQATDAARASAVSFAAEVGAGIDATREAAAGALDALRSLFATSRAAADAAPAPAAPKVELPVSASLVGELQAKLAL
ncbi:MAG TPA: hypothetical protein VFH78_07665 [Candidatus Thermoplasmatota archaeon]|nr:hypothetical protein [Candidatus Thermoplasmatota archaeon]